MRCDVPGADVFILVDWKEVTPFGKLSVAGMFDELT
jgi:hypothetical protein